MNGSLNNNNKSQENGVVATCLSTLTWRAYANDLTWNLRQGSRANEIWESPASRYLPVSYMTVTLRPIHKSENMLLKFAAFSPLSVNIFGYQKV